MAPNNALGNASAARQRAAAEGVSVEELAPTGRRSKSPARAGSKSPARAKRDVRVASADGFGAGSMVPEAEVRARGVGTVVRTPLEEFESRPRSELRNFWTGVMFLTRLPCPGWCDHHPGHLMRSLAWFPVLGALIGIWAAAIFEATVTLWHPMIAAALSMGGTIWLTGCFHEDGLCDTLDGFGGGWTKKQILAIMKDSRNGTYATVGGCLWVLAKVCIDIPI